jgi:hypothetical protein
MNRKVIKKRKMDEEGRIRRLWIWTLMILAVSVLSWNCLSGKVWAADNLIPTFGQGPVKISIFTDYFCPPCRGLEPKIEPIIKELMEKGMITLTFVDTPTNPHTSLYTRQFIYALNFNRDFQSALYARHTLFEAAERNITEKTYLEEFLKERVVDLKPVDIAPVLAFWNQTLKEEEINSTPSCVIVNGDKKEKLRGSLDILKALEILNRSVPKEAKSPESGTPDGKDAKKD